MNREVFDLLGDRYDAWFDTPQGSAIFDAELDCLRMVMPGDRSGWIEVGVGSGRFAAALGVSEGVDPSAAMLRRAAARRIKTVRATAEGLPYSSRSVSGILLVVTLCFLDRPARAISEFARVLRKDGKLVVGIVPADSRWGKRYQLQAQEGHPFYSAARFHTSRDVTRMAEAAEFRLITAVSALPMGPDEPLREGPAVSGAVPDHGFVALLFGKRAPANRAVGKDHEKREESSACASWAGPGRFVLHSGLREQRPSRSLRH